MVTPLLHGTSGITLPTSMIDVSSLKYLVYATSGITLPASIMDVISLKYQANT
jgi:hypothetical protein